MLAVMTHWQYEPYLSLHGGLQRGQGFAVAWLRDNPDRASLVYTCANRDTRWDRQVDDRYTYLARLLRNLRLDLAPLIAQLRSCGPRPDPDDTNRFELAAGILRTLARTGDNRARDALRDYVRDGLYWIDVLESLPDEWPVDWWDDLNETAAARLTPRHASKLLPGSQPWQRWLGRNPRLDVILDIAARDRAEPRARRTDLAAASDADLIAALVAPGTGRPEMAAVLRQIRNRDRPVPELLDVVELLATVNPLGLFGALRAQAGLVVPQARAWAANPDHPLFLDAPHLLAEHGDERDMPLLLAALDQLADQWCGIDTLTEGLTRILTSASPPAHTEARAVVVQRLRRQVLASPHSYERTSYLRSLLQLDPPGTTTMLPLFLLDCEPKVRLLAAQHTPLTERARRWLTELRDDPIEDDDVRHIAAQRLT